MSFQHPTPAPGDPVAETRRTVDLYAVMVGILADSAPATRRVCRHCGDSASVAREQAEPLCPVGESFGHSYLDMPVSS